MDKLDGKDDSEDVHRSRPSSRRNSVSLPRGNGLKKERDKQSPQSASSAQSTPKRSARPSLDLVVTGKQILKRSDRASSLPGSCRRQSSEAAISHTRPQRISEGAADSARSHETTLEDDLSLDLSQVSGFEESNLKYGLSQAPLATSTPMPPAQKSKRSASPQSHLQQRAESSRRSQPSSQMSVELPRGNRQTLPDGRGSTFCSRDSLYRTSSSASPYKCDGEDSLVSPEYSQRSESPLAAVNASPSPVLSSWAEGGAGEWSSFWADYNHALPKPTAGSCYDQCPTPYRSHNADLDFELSTEDSRLRTPDHVAHIGSIIRSEGLRLTPRETQSIVKCAHMLGNVLSHAIDRRARERDDKMHEANIQRKETEEPEIEIKKKTLTLDLKETNIPDVQEEKRCEATTQTDISLPNTKSAPRIFENILRQLSKSSIDVPKAEDGK